MAKSLSAITAVSTGTVISVPSDRRCMPRMVQCSITVGTATVIVKGRAAPDAPWVTIYTFTASDMVALYLPAEVAMDVTVVAGGGVVSGWLDAQ